ncbi:MFS transporter [Halalkalibaculum sp. DA3122]|uniref:MFS transporter n=1 Tax=unclassified Halalkalibaculum TaxID=2964617 RepID=UPI003754D4FD
MKKRVLFVIGTFTLSLLLYIDRAMISAAEESISHSLGFTDTQMGWVFAIFALGYSLAQVPTGYVADRYGPRKLLTGIVTAWSTFTIATGAAYNFISMLVARFLFGAGEAGAFPGMSRAVYSWIPLKERGIVTGINFSGSRIGAAVALPAVAWLISTIGWRMSFIVFGIIGFFWALLWYWWFRDDPEDHPGISDEEKQYILETRQKLTKEEAEGKLSYWNVLKSGNVILAMFQYFGSNFIFFFCLSWLFPYLKQTYDLTMVETGFYASAPFLAGAAGNFFSGFLVDYIYRKGKWKLSRRLPAIMGFTLVAVGVLASMQMDTPGGAVLFLSIAIFGADMTLSPSWSFCVDIGKKFSGTVSGTMNMAGNFFGSFLASLAFPYLTSLTGSTDTFFYLAAFFAVLSIIAWSFMNPDKPIETI